MNKLILLTAAFIGLTLIASAQDKKLVEKKSTNKTVESKQRTMTPQFKTSSTPKSNVSSGNQTLLQELYLIEDDRQRIEKDQSLTQSERSQKTQENNKTYTTKKQEFMTDVASKGILNVSKQEQNYYLYLLKYDKKVEEYTENINLIKNSK